MVKASSVHRCFRWPPAPANRAHGLAPLGRSIGAIVFLAAATATAAPPQNSDPWLAPWFRSLTNPTIVGESCCAEADGHILGDAVWREDGDQYEIQVGGSWWPVPQESVLDHVPNPTGGAVAFWETHGHGVHKGPRIYCFVRPAEG
jgi:hypothetical protein